MDQPGRTAHLSPIVHLDDDIDVAAQLVQRFGYEEAERIMLDALDGRTSVDEEARRAEARRTVRPAQGPPVTAPDHRL